MSESATAVSTTAQEKTVGTNGKSSFRDVLKSLIGQVVTTIGITYEATDGCGNASSCVQIITLVARWPNMAEWRQ